MVFASRRERERSGGDAQCMTMLRAGECPLCAQGLNRSRGRVLGASGGGSIKAVAGWKRPVLRSRGRQPHSRHEHPHDRPGDEPVAPTHDRRRPECEIIPCPANQFPVIPGREQSSRTRNPDTDSELVSGFRVRAFGAPRNDRIIHPDLVSHRRLNNVTSAPPRVRMTKPVQLEMQ